jgi:hypothetical protein
MSEMSRQEAMMRHFRIAAVCLALAMLQLPLSMAQSKPTVVPAAPVPAQILSAKKVFLANAGGDQPLLDDPQFSGGVERSYNQFYAAIKAWGRYEIVAAPGDADLLLEIQFTVPPVGGPVVRGDTIGGRPYDPQFRLVIRDPKTTALLWAFTEHAQWAILQGNRDRNFDQALTRIVSDVQGLSASADANKP